MLAADNIKVPSLSSFQTIVTVTVTTQPYHTVFTFVIVLWL